jgi:type 2 lantibiotic biosynthesis protein LanM
LLPDPEDESPDWWSVCQGVIDHPVPEETVDADYLSRKGEELIPFEHVFLPWIEVATRMLESTDPELFRKIHPDVLREEQRGLLVNLSTCSRSMLLMDFEQQKIGSYDSNDLFLGLIVKRAPDKIYRRFTRSIIEDSWQHYLETYPALARLLATRVVLWVKSLHEFLHRLEVDRDLLQETYSPDSPLGALVKGGRGISDSHNGARAVVICRFENGCKIVYKPRSMSVDFAWQKACEWLNDRGDIVDPLESIMVQDRGNYGWMKCIEQRPCRDMTEVKLYYKRMGELLCLVHLFHGNDFHLENVVASGPNPVAIDLETITVADIDKSSINRGMLNSPAGIIASRSVLRTLLLPMAMSRGGGAMNLGAVGILVDNKRGGTSQRILTGVNTDFLSWKLVSPKEAGQKTQSELQSPNHSAVTLVDGEDVVPQDHLEDLCEGYQSAYHSIMEIKDEFCGPNGPMSHFEGVITRFINRATTVYYRLLIETTNSEHITSGLERWFAIERISVGFSSTDERSLNIMCYFCDQEHLALLRGDIPYFAAVADSFDVNTLDIKDCEILTSCPGVFENSAINSVNQQFESMSQEDCLLQLGFIHSSYITTISTLLGTIHGSDDEISYDDPPARDLREGEIEEFSRSILDRLLDEALVGESEQIDWLDVSVDPIRNACQIVSMDCSIYAGRGGMSLGFELGYRRFGDQRYLDAASQALLLESSIMETAPDNMLLSPSGLLYTPGFLLAGWRVGGHEGHGSLRDHVTNLIGQIGPRVIERDKDFDLLGGSAGMILILAMILEDGGPSVCRSIIERLGEHLLKNVNQQHGGPSWRGGSAAISLCGLGHGSAGIALSLIKAWKITGREDFRSCALAAIACEHRLRNEEMGNWPDFRTVSSVEETAKATSSNGAWCFGYPGIAAGRAAFLEIEDDPIARSDLEFSLESFRRFPFTRPMARPHLCCGSFGMMEIHRTIGSRLGMQSELDASSDLLQECIQIQNDRSLALGCMGQGLFQGLMGLAWGAITGEGKVQDADDLLILS